jgi:hypothetical protein
MHPTPTDYNQTTMQTAIEPVLQACRQGHQALLVSGRSLSDLHVNERDSIRPLRQTLFRRAKEEFGMASLVFNLAEGAGWNWSGHSVDERKAHEQLLVRGGAPLSAGINAAADPATPPFERAYRLLSGIKRCIDDGQTMPPMLALWEFGEDLVPEMQCGTCSVWMLQIAELLQLFSSDYRRRMHPLLFILNGSPDLIDRRIVRAFHPVHLCQPDREEKLRFIGALKEAPATRAATFDQGLDENAMSNLTANTPNHSLEEAFLGSAKTGQPLSHAQLVANKRADVVSLSEGTLSLLDTDRVSNTRLVGRTIERPLALLERWAIGLKNGDPHTPMNVLLAGAPSSAKTDLAILTAMKSGTPAYSVLSPKGSLVGQTERLVRLLFSVFKEQSPAFGVMDEITEAFPTQRHSMNLDSGASSAVTAEMLNALSDSSRAGRTLLIATTNCPWLVGAAMASRFLYVPVLSAIADDYPDILCAVAASLLPEVDWNPRDATIREAAMIFHRKGASPRVMRTLISSKIGTSGESGGVTLILRAAKACAPQDPRDRASAEYADLFAIRACSDMEMLPWHGRMTDYPLPDYLKSVIDQNTGEPDPEQLNQRIEELKPHVNV